MSGQKCARVDLNAEAKRELERILGESRRNARTQASLANLRGRVESALKEVEHYLASPEISDGFREKLKEFQSLAAVFIARHGELRARLDRIEGLRNHADPIAARNEAARLQREIGQATGELERLAAQIAGRQTAMEESMVAEQRGEEYRVRMADQRRRGELAGLAEELRLRLHPATSLNLQTVAERAGGLLDRVEGLRARQERVSEDDVKSCRAALDDLTREVEQREGEVQKQWAIFTRLNEAFEGAGFNLDTPVNMPQYDVPIHARHIIADDERRASVSSLVYKDGEVNLEMSGASGEGEAFVGRDQHCDLNLARIVQKALECGLVVRDVVWKDPNDPSGWTGMNIVGTEDYVADEDGPVIQKPREVPMEQEMR